MLRSIVRISPFLLVFVMLSCTWKFSKAQLGGSKPIDAVAFFGFKKGQENDNTLALIRMSNFINSRKKDIHIFFKRGTYQYSPYLHFEENNAWRRASEILNSHDLKIVGDSVFFQLNVPKQWKIGDSKNLGNDEGYFQFRSTKNDLLSGLTIVGIHHVCIKPYGAFPNNYISDGASFGFAFRGCVNVIVKNCSALNWRTDGIYVGTAYGNQRKSKDVYVYGCSISGNSRQGISIVGADNVLIEKCQIRDTGGSSLGHGVDLETNKKMTQSNIIIRDCDFVNNERGSINVIRTRKVKIVNCRMNENNCNGAIYCDGDKVRNVIIDSCVLVTSKAALYILGDDIQDFWFINSEVETTSIPSNGATIRLMGKGVEREINVQNVMFEGNGGVYVNGGVANIDACNFHQISHAYFNTGAKAELNLTDNRISIDSTYLFKGERDCYISKGTVKGNLFISHAKAIYTLSNTNAGRSTNVGENDFHDFFYFKDLTPKKKHLRRLGKPKK